MSTYSEDFLTRFRLSEALAQNRLLSEALAQNSINSEFHFMEGVAKMAIVWVDKPVRMHLHTSK